MKSQRNQSIELLRLCFVFEIVLLHVMTQGGYFSRTGINLLLTAVAGFVFISGWFGIKLRGAKIVGLICVAAFYRILFGRGCGYHSFICDWFLWAYVALMMVAPLVDAAFAGRGKKEVLRLGLPIVIGIYFWSYLGVVPFVKAHVPVPYGFAPLSYSTLIGIYVAARMFRLLEVDKYLVGRKIPALLVASAGALVLIGFHHHNSPASFIMVSTLFVLFKRLTLPKWLSSAVSFAAPSAFAVYILHSSAWGHVFFVWGLKFCIANHGLNQFTAYFIVATLLYIACLAIDGVRRLALSPIKNFLALGHRNRTPENIPMSVA